MIAPNLGLFTAAAPACAAINHLLAQEPAARAALQRHSGKVAAIDSGAVVLRLQVTADGYLQPAEAETEARVTISLKLADVPLMLQNRARAFSYVQIAGDAELANTISTLSNTLRWDAEQDLEKVLGPVAAVRMVAGAKSAFEMLRTGQRKLAENVAEFLLEERPVLVRPEVVEGFSADVVRLRDDVERAAKRLAKLEAKLQAKLEQKLEQTLEQNTGSH